MRNLTYQTRTVVGVAVVMLYSAPVILYAANTITGDAGSILRDQQQRIEKEAPVFKPNPPLTAPQTEASLKETESIRFLVKSFVIEGNTQFSEQPLQMLLAELRNKEYTLNTLEEAIGVLSRYYWEHRFPLAYAYLPPQEIEDGVVKIRIVEGEYGQIGLENTSRTLNSILEAHLEAERTHVIIDGERLESLLNRIKEMTASDEVLAEFKKGGTRKQSDMTVRVKEAPRFSGSVEANNYGSSYIGSNYLEGTVYWNNPMGWGDRADVKVSSTGHGADFILMGYALPIGVKGWKFDAHYSRSRYQLGGAFDSLLAHGVGGQWSFHAKYPFMSLYDRALNLDFGLYRKNLKDEMDKVSFSTDKTLDSASIGLNGFLTAGTKQRVNYSFVLTGGKIKTDTTQLITDPFLLFFDPTHTKSETKEDQTFSKFSYYISHYLTCSERSYLTFNVSGQYAFNNLDSAEKISLGGIYGVRAYRAGILSADTAYIANLEWHQFLPSPWLGVGLKGMLFADVAEARVNVHPISNAANKRDFSGVGAGLTWSFSGKSTLQFLFALRTRADAVENNPGARGWVQWVTRF